MAAVFFAAVLDVSAADAGATPRVVVPSYSSPRAVGFSPNGKVVVCNLAVYDLAGKVLGKSDQREGATPCSSVCFSPDGRRLATVHRNIGLTQSAHDICLWDVSARNEIRKTATLFHAELRGHDYVESLDHLTFSLDGELVAAVMPGDAAAVWSTSDGKERLRIDCHGLVVGFSPDNRMLATVTRMGLIEHWDVATGKRLPTAADAPKRGVIFVCEFAVSADRKTVALSDNHTVVLKEVESGRVVRRIGGVEHSQLALSPDGNTLAVGGDEEIIFFDVVDGREIGSLGTFDWEAQSMTFTPDGKRLAANSTTAVGFWDVAQARPRKKRAAAANSEFELKLDAKRTTYRVAADDKSSEEFARVFRISNPRPKAQEVDLTLTIRNTSGKKRTLTPGVWFRAHLDGEGAVNLPDLPRQVGLHFSNNGPPDIVLMPGESHSIPVKALVGTNVLDPRSYWTLPGEYVLHVSCFLFVSGDDKKANTDWYDLKVDAPPLRLNVVPD
jgi:WD40 repeat protein